MRMARALYSDNQNNQEVRVHDHTIQQWGGTIIGSFGRGAIDNDPRSKSRISRGSRAFYLFSTLSGSDWATRQLHAYRQRERLDYHIGS